MDNWGVGSGAAVGDLNGDNKLDMVLARCHLGSGGRTVYLRQTGGGGDFPNFTSSPSFASVFTGVCAHAVGFGDYDNDGDLDVFVGANGADVLLRNNGFGAFTNVTAAAGVAGPAGDITTGAIFADVNADGLLDLYVLGHAVGIPPGSDPLNANRLYINNGDGSFREVADSAGAAGDGSTQAALISDLDGDGDMDIYVANDTFAVEGSGGWPGLDADQFLDSVLYDTSGTPSYVDMASAYNLDGPRSSMAVALTDLDGDGREDIYVTDFGSNHLAMWNPTSVAYDEVAASWGLALSQNPMTEYNVSWGARFVDFDRNGEVELALANGYTNPPVNCEAWSQLDMFLRRDDGADNFSDITGSVGWSTNYTCPAPVGTPLMSRGIVLGDLDGDGDDDMIITPWDEPYRFFRNDTDQSGRRRVRIRPTGSVSAPDPTGLVMEVTTLSGKTIRRTLYAGGDTHSQSDRVLEVGLREDAAVTSVWLHWPSGYSQRADQTSGFVLDSELKITEPAWLTISSRVVASTDPTPTLTYRPVADDGSFLGAAGSGKTVTGFRSDMVPVMFSDDGNGNYTAPLPHPGSAQIMFITVIVDGVVQRARLTVNYKP